jgi:hypothetical protein
LKLQVHIGGTDVPSYTISMRQEADPKKLALAPRYLVLDAAGAPTTLTRTAWLKAILDSFPKENGKPIGELLFFVHGYNVSSDHARAGDVSNLRGLRGAKWGGVYVSYDWPSYGNVLEYYSDRGNARHSANGLVLFALSLFVKASLPDCLITLSVMTHSMGGFLVREALTWAHQDQATNAKSWQLAQLLMVAGDVSSGSLSASQPGGRWIDAYCARTTLYTNHFDNVLQISDIKNGEPTPRAGRVGLPVDAPASFCGVDCSDLYVAAPISDEDRLNPGTAHGFYLSNPVFWQDAVLTLYGGIDRNAMPLHLTQAPGMANRFKLAPAALPQARYDTYLAMAGGVP